MSLIEPTTKPSLEEDLNKAEAGIRKARALKDSIIKSIDTNYCNGEDSELDENEAKDIINVLLHVCGYIAAGAFKKSLTAIMSAEKNVSNGFLNEMRDAFPKIEKFKPSFLRADYAAGNAKIGFDLDAELDFSELRRNLTAKHDALKSIMFGGKQPGPAFDSKSLFGLGRSGNDDDKKN